MCVCVCACGFCSMFFQSRGCSRRFFYLELHGAATSYTLWIPVRSSWFPMGSHGFYSPKRPIFPSWITRYAIYSWHFNFAFRWILRQRADCWAPVSHQVPAAAPEAPSLWPRRRWDFRRSHRWGFNLGSPRDGHCRCPLVKGDPDRNQTD